MAHKIKNLEESDWEKYLDFCGKFVAERQPFFKINEVGTPDKEKSFDGLKHRFIVLIDDEVVGFFFYWKYSKVGASIGYGLLGETQGQGIGTAMYEHIVMHAKENGIIELRAYLAVANWRSIVLLCKRGFKVFRETEGHIMVRKRLI